MALNHFRTAHFRANHFTPLRGLLAAVAGVATYIRHTLALAERSLTAFYTQPKNSVFKVRDHG